MTSIDFLKYQSQLRLRKTAEKTYVFDPIRRKEIVLQPEELLRQLVVQYLLTEKKYPLGRIRVEMGVKINGLPKRADIVVFDAAGRAWLLVECKSPKVKLTQASFEQSARYNLNLQVPFLAVTNGLATFCCRVELEEKSFEFLPDFPEMQNADEV